MEGKKCIFIVATFIIALAVNSYCMPNEHNNRYVREAENKTHNLRVGSRTPGDELLFQKNIVKESKWLRKVIVEETFNMPTYSIITLVEALDQKTNGNGAYASLTNGGPGSQNVKLRFKSQRGHGINFVVKIYGRRNYY